MEIKLEHVTKKIKGVAVLQDVTKTFTGGCIYGLSGKNGCGKTMLMRTMAGLIYPTGGAVKINGKTLGKDISFPPSMGLLIEKYIGKTGRRLFLGFCWLFTLIVIAAFADMVHQAGTFAAGDHSADIVFALTHRKVLANGFN